MIPSGRVFRRDGDDGRISSCMHYGDVTLRVRRTLWQEVLPRRFRDRRLGRSAQPRMRNEPRTGMIREMLWDESARAIHYFIAENDLPIPQPLQRDDLQHVEPI